MLASFFEVSWLPNLLASTLLALVWSVLETHGAPLFISALEKYGGSYIRDRAVQLSSWTLQFKTAHPGLYLLIHLIPSFALVSNGFVEDLAKLGLGLWFGDESEGDSAPPVVGGGGENERLITPSQNQG